MGQDLVRTTYKILVGDSIISLVKFGNGPMWAIGEVIDTPVYVRTWKNRDGAPQYNLVVNDREEEAPNLVS